jgi:hypothetical protein
VQARDCIKIFDINKFLEEYIMIKKLLSGIMSVSLALGSMGIITSANSYSADLSAYNGNLFATYNCYNNSGSTEYFRITIGKASSGALASNVYTVSNYSGVALTARDSIANLPSGTTTYYYNCAAYGVYPSTYTTPVETSYDTRYYTK